MRSEGPVNTGPMPDIGDIGVAGTSEDRIVSLGGGGSTVFVGARAGEVGGEGDVFDRGVYSYDGGASR